MISIREVAKLAGVSPATVSRVMNSTANVNEEKRQRVLRVIQETGFRPNETARTLYKKSARIISMIVPNIDNPFFNEMTQSIEAEVYRHDYRLMLCNSNNDVKKELHNIELLTRMNADGLILLTNGGKIFQKIHQFDIPVVALDRELWNAHDITCLESDHYEGGRLSMEHLLQCGCKNIVNMRGPQELSSGRKRFEGYLHACQKHRVVPKFVDCKYDYEDGLKQAEAILRTYPDVDGIIAANDMVALSVYKVLAKHGKRVPEDIQLIGFDNIRLSHIMTPELTTIAQPIKEMGRQAVLSLIDQIEGKQTQTHYTFEVNLIERQTTLHTNKRDA